MAQGLACSVAGVGRPGGEFGRTRSAAQGDVKQLSHVSRGRGIERVALAAIIAPTSYSEPPPLNTPV